MIVRIIMLNIILSFLMSCSSGKLSVIHSYKEPKDTISEAKKELSPVLLDSIQATEEIKLDTVLTIAYGACYGKCPVYDITLYNSGLIIYTGNKNADRFGQFSLQINTEEEKIIENMIVHNDIGNLSDYYPTDKEATIPDFPLTKYFFKIGIKSKMIIVNNSPPRSLTQIEKTIHSYLQTKSWKKIAN